MIPWTRFRTPINFGDEFSLRQYYVNEVTLAHECQRVRFAVAPRLNLKTPCGAVIPTGGTVKLADLEGDPQEGPIVKLRRLVEEGWVIEREPEGDAA